MRRLMMVTVILAFAATGLVWAEAGDQKVRFRLNYSSTSGDLSDSATLVDEPVEDPDGVVNGTLSAKVELDGAAGLDVEYEYYLTDLIGISPAVASAEYDVDESASGNLTFTPSGGGPDETVTLAGGVKGETRIVPLTVALNFHLIRKTKIDFYLGPVIGYVLIDDVELDPGTLTLTFDNDVLTVPVEGAVNPLSVHAGVGVRF